MMRYFYYRILRLSQESKGSLEEERNQKSTVLVMRIFIGVYLFPLLILIDDVIGEFTNFDAPLHNIGSVTFIGLYFLFIILFTKFYVFYKRKPAMYLETYKSHWLNGLFKNWMLPLYPFFWYLILIGYYVVAH